MKFIRLISTFKNGLVSPRLRGSMSSPQDFSSAEILDNFIVDRVGTACKRPGLRLRSSADKGNIQTFKLTFLDTEYLVRFNNDNTFNAVDGSYISTFCQISSNAGFSYDPVYVFSKGPVSYNAGNPIAYSLSMWNGKHVTGGSYINTGLADYLNAYLTIKQVVKVSDRTVVFTTGSFSFLLTLFDYFDKETSQTTRRFIIYPYFVSAVALQNTLGETLASAAESCPIVPSNFPFNPINTDTTMQVSFAVFTVSGNAQLGSDTPSGVVAKSNTKFVWNMTVPRQMVYVNGSKVSLVGRFISVPSSDATKDVVFFITKETTETATTIDYTCIQVIGGTPGTGIVASQWKLSTWGGSSHPRTVGYCFGRLIYANTVFNPSRWWASATHPINTQYFQGFMEYRLLQDSNSDFSGINYQGSTGSGVTDIYRYGFTELVPSGGAINWISHRRRVHFGTSKGECQATTSDGVFDASSYQQTQTGTNRSDAIQHAEGDRKIFYISNYGKDIRSISTEDKDYESVDKLLTIPIEGLDLKFTKIEWIEEYFALFCLTEDKRLFIMAVHSDTEVRAISELNTAYPVLDFAGTFVLIETPLWSTVGSPTVMSICSLDTTNLGNGFKPVHADAYFWVSSMPGFDFSFFGNYSIYIYHNGTEYFIEDASTIVYLTDLPFDYTEVTEATPMYVYPSKFKARMKTPPIAEGQNYGSAVGNLHRVDRISVLVDKSGPFKYGTDENNLMPAENIVYPTTKVVNIDFPASTEVEQCVYIESEDPTPLNISGISLRGVSYSGE